MIFGDFSLGNIDFKIIETENIEAEAILSPLLVRMRDVKFDSVRVRLTE